MAPRRARNRSDDRRADGADPTPADDDELLEGGEDGDLAVDDDAGPVDDRIRDVRVVLEPGIFKRAQVIDVETGEVRAVSDPFGSEAEAIADARLMICDNEREVP